MRLASVIRWPGMQRFSDEQVKKCPTCQKLRAHRPQPESMASTAAKQPYESVFVDYLGPLRISSEGFKYILVMIDRFSHEVSLEATKDTTANTTTLLFHDSWICRFGIPRMVTTDGGSSFAATTFAEFLALLRSKHHISAPYHPEGHGAVERVNSDVMQMLHALFKRNRDWPTLVKTVEFAISTTHSCTLYIPSFPSQFTH